MSKSQEFIVQSQRSKAALKHRRLVAWSQFKVWLRESGAVCLCLMYAALGLVICIFMAWLKAKVGVA